MNITPVRLGTIITLVGALAACGGEEAGTPAPGAVKAPETAAPPAAAAEKAAPIPSDFAIIRTIEGFSTPESALHDTANDVYLVANINGDPFGAGTPGFISRVAPDGAIIDLKWIDGAAEGVRLNAPKGMAIVGDTLYVADVTVVRKFNLASGAPVGAIAIPSTTFLNDIAADADGNVYVSDSGFGPGFEPSGTDAIYRIAPDDALSTVASGTSLNNPNGLMVDGGELFIGDWAAGGLHRAPLGKAPAPWVTLPHKQIDGLLKAGEAGYVLSSWEAASLYRVAADGSAEMVGPSIEAPADLGYDASRGILLVPQFMANVLLLVR